MERQHLPLILLILDGWGYSEQVQHNAIAAAHTPHWDSLWQQCPHILISGSGQDVGLPEGQMGNSEVGHLTIGAGRLVPQDLVRIDNAIASGEFFTNPVLVNAVQQAVHKQKAVHILGLLSPGGVHSHENHILAMLELAAQQGAKKIYFHAFLDGRDTPPRSAAASLAVIEEKFKQLNIGRIASITGRYYAMDRDKRWERTQSTFNMLTLGQADYQASSAVEALQMAYERGETDEFVKPTLIQSPVILEDDDSIIFMNFRADRARQLTRALTQENFIDFPRPQLPKFSAFVSLTEYAADIKTAIAYPPIPMTHILGECLSEHHLIQLRIAETEKYAHVTFFFNGGNEQPYPGETRILIPSPKINTYDLQPEMSAYDITQHIVDAIHSKQFDVIICNYANPDMVGHTGNYAAAVQAIEAIDQCLGRIIKAVDTAGGELIITADHGNAECMFDETTRQPHTAHTTELVPFIYKGRPAQFLQNSGTLADIAPTLLYLLNIPQPSEMTGKCLLKIKPEN